MSIVAPFFWKIQSLIGSTGPRDAISALEREGEPHAALGAAPLHDRQEPGGLGLGEQVLELGERLGRLGHADLLRPASCCRRRRSGCS